MPRARLAIALALATAIAVLVWQLARGERTSLNSPAEQRQAPATPENRSETRFVPGPRIVPKSLREADVVEDAAAADSRAADAPHSGARVGVLVVDEASAPQDDVPVFLLEGGHARPVIRRSATGRDGVAFFSLAPKGQAGNPGANSEVTVAIALPLDERVEVVLDRKQIPEGLIRLVLPPTGHVVVRLVTADGAAFTGTATVVLRRADDRDTRFEDRFDALARSAVSTPAVDGVATFARIGKAPRLEVRATPADASLRKVHTHLDGPRGPGDSTITLVCGGKASRVTGRLVRPDAKPIPGATLSINLPASPEAFSDDTSWSYMTSARSGDDGRFEARCEVDPATITLTEARLAVDEPTTTPLAPGESPASQKITVPLPESIRTGLADLGDVMVPEVDLIASGQVVTDQGAPVAGATVVVMTERRDHKWYWDWELEELSKPATDQGTFEIYGKVKTSRVGLAAELTGWTCVAPTPCKVGARDVRVTLVRAGGIAGSIAGLAKPDPRNWASSPIAVSVVKSGVTSERREYRDYREPLDLDRREVDLHEGKFEAKPLLPGTYAVELYAKARGDEEVTKPLVVVDGVVVRGGETTRDPRLQDIALSKLLRVHEITVVDEQGRPLTGAAVGARPAGKEGDFRHFITGDGGKALVTTPDAEVDLVVAMKGYRAETLPNVAADANVTLRKTTPMAVMVSLPENVELPAPPLYLGVSLNWMSPTDPSLAHWSDPRNRDTEPVFFGSDRKITVGVDSPGTYVAIVWLNERHARGGGSINFGHKEAARVTVGEEGGASMTVTIDPKKLERTLAERKKQK